MTGTISTNETLNGGVEAIPTLSGTLSGNATSSYNSLSDKPIINGTTLEGGVDRSLVEDVKVNGVSVVNEEYIAEIENSAEDVPYDNSSSTGVQATNVQDALDEAFQRTMDMSTWFTDVVAESYNYIKHYTVGDYVFYFPSIGVTKLYRCIENTSGAFDSTKWEEVKIADEIKEVNSTIDNLLIQKSIENTDIASFSDGSNLPMPSLKVGIEPQQDLHGYDSPWVGGSGKNKLPLTVETVKSLNASGTWSGNAYTINNVTFTLLLDNGGNVIGININGTASAEINPFKLGNITFEQGSSYKITGGNDASINGVVLGCNGFGTWETNEEKIIDRTTSTTFDSFTYIKVASGTVISNKVIKPMIRLASVTDATFAPYSNICPISGWSAVNVTRCGKNLFDKTTIGNGNINDVDGAVQKPTAVYKHTDYIKVVGGESYYIKTSQTSGSWGAWYDKNKNYISGITQYADSVITAPSNAVYMRLTILNESYVDSFGVNYPSTDTSYHAYNGQTYTIPFTDSQGNPIEVYGGTLDVVSGELTVDRAIRLVSNCTWYGSNGGFYTDAVISSIKHGDGRFDHVISNVYKTENVGSISPLSDGGISVDASGYVQLKDSRYSTASDFKTAMGTTQLVYELATPLTYQLTPTQVKSLLGSNNVWCDTGKVIKLEYLANATDVIASLDARITALENA